MRNLLFVFLFIVSACTTAQDKTQFSKEGLADVMISLDGVALPFSEIINQYKGKKVVIDVWASWCGDCIGGMPKVKEIQKETDEDVVFLFLSVDKNVEAWKKGIQKHHVEGAHYFVQSGWKGAFNKSIQLDWIPRYMVVDTTGKIVHWKSKTAKSKKLEEAIKN